MQWPSYLYTKRTCAHVKSKDLKCYLTGAKTGIFKDQHVNIIADDVISHGIDCIGSTSHSLRKFLLFLHHLQY